MIFIKLLDLLKEKNISISELSKATKISRSTIYNMSSIDSKGLQWGTLDKICMFLKVSPSDIFIFLPFSLNIDIIKSEVINLQKKDLAVDNKKGKKTIKTITRFNFIHIYDGFIPCIIEFSTRCGNNKVITTPIYKKMPDCNFVADYQIQHPLLSEYIKKALYDIFLNNKDFKKICVECFEINIENKNFSIMWEYFEELFLGSDVNI